MAVIKVTAIGLVEVAAEAVAEAVYSVSFVNFFSPTCLIKSMIVTDWFRLDNLLSQMELLSFDNVKKQKFHACNDRFRDFII